MKINEKILKKSIFIFTIIIIACIILIPISKYADENDIQIKSYPTNDEGDFTVEINGNNNLKDVRLYKKVGDKYILFYTSSNINLSKKIYKIPKSKLSTSEETDIKVGVTDVNGNKKEVDVKAPKVPKYTPAPSPKKPTPSKQPQTSTTPTTPQPGENNPQNQTGSITISLDKKTLMLDKHHYKNAQLKATVTPSNAKVTYSSSNTKVVSVNKNTGWITAKGYGTAKITATAKVGNKTKTAKCNIRVITTMREKTSDSEQFDMYRKDLGGWLYYYLRYYDRQTKKVTKNASWTNAEVESYINNAEWLVKKYPSKYYEAKKYTYAYFPTFDNKDTGKKIVTKPYGQLCMNGKHGKYILLFTTKNQWLYLLKKENGVWKIDAKARSSSGYNWGVTSNGTFHKYITRSNNDCGLAFMTYFPIESRPKYAGVVGTNAVHIGNTFGYPTTSGCLCIDRDSELTRRLKTIFREDKTMIKVIYY